MAKNILLTGATGTMGSVGLEELLKDKNNNITILLRPLRINKKKTKKYKNNPRIRIIWGDLRNYDDVLESVKGNDIVLHVGGMVSPKADKFYELTMETNVLAAKNIVKAIKQQTNADKIKLVYIGTIAEIGYKEVPNHFGATGDLLQPSLFDHYAVSKIMAEKIIAESGLKYWVSLRQTAILYSKIIKGGLSPITFHIPLRGVLEWATVEDSGRLLANVCKDDVPDKFWNNFYNISSGKSYRLTNYEFECKLLNAIYCPPPEKIFEANWFATKNFHGCWYSDSYILDDYLHFRENIPCNDYFINVIRKNIPWYYKLVKIVPSILLKKVMQNITNNDKDGTMNWIKNRNEEKVKVYFGSYEEWKKLPNWDGIDKSHPSEEDENTYLKNNAIKAIEEWDLQYMHDFAKYRNGKCLSESMKKGDCTTPLLWENSTGQKFKASPKYVIIGGFFPDQRLLNDMNYKNYMETNI